MPSRVKSLWGGLLKHTRGFFQTLSRERSLSRPSLISDKEPPSFISAGAIGTILRRLEMKGIIAACCFLIAYGEVPAQEFTQLFDPILSIQESNLNLPNNIDLNARDVSPRALGMGGAFLGIADDPSALWGNAAGLGQLTRPEVYLVGSLHFRAREYDTPPFSGTEIVSKIDPHGSVEGGGLVFPLPFGRMRLVPGIAYKRVIDMNQKIDQSRYVYGGGLVETTQRFQGGISAFSPTVALQITSNMYTGVTLHILSGSAEYTYEFIEAYTDEGVFKFQDEESYSGNSLDLGILIKGTDQFSFGLKITPSWQLSYEFESSSFFFPIVDSVVSAPPESLADGKLKVPVFYGIGVAVRPLNGFTLGIDYQVNPWSKAERKTQGSWQKADFEDQHLFRIGMEYMLTHGLWTVPLRVGYYSHPSPYKDGISAFGQSNKSDQIKGDVFTFGAGLKRGAFVFDAAYEHGLFKETHWWDYYNNRELHTKRRMNRIVLAVRYLFEKGP